jgi:hypothetical protein
MKIFLGTILAATTALAQLNCLSPNTTTVRLVNNGDFPVDVELRTSSDQLILRDVLAQGGDRTDETVAAGAIATLTFDCDDLQAIMVENADLQVAGDVGPQADTDVYRDGDDFGCGDTITFTFDHPVVPLTLDIDVSVQG